MGMWVSSSGPYSCQNRDAPASSALGRACLEFSSQMVGKDRRSSMAAFCIPHFIQYCVFFWPKYFVYFHSSGVLIFPRKIRIVRPLMSKYFKRTTTIFQKTFFLNWCFETDRRNGRGLGRRGTACRVSHKVHWHKHRHRPPDYWARWMAQPAEGDNNMRKVRRTTSHANTQCKYASSLPLWCLRRLSLLLVKGYVV